MSDSHGGAQNPRAAHTRSSVPRDICLQMLMLKGLTVNYANEVHIGHCHSSTGTDGHSFSRGAKDGDTLLHLAALRMHREIGMTLVAKGLVFSHTAPTPLRQWNETKRSAARSHSIIIIGRRQRERHEQQGQDPASQLRRGDGQSAWYHYARSLGRFPPPHSCVCLTPRQRRPPCAVSSGHLMMTEIKDPQNEMRRGTDVPLRVRSAFEAWAHPLFPRCSGAEGHVGRPHQLLCSIRYALPPQ
jgi:hypothetical protein